MVFQNKPDSRPHKPTRWGTAAANILRAAGVDQTPVADAAGITKQHLSNCLTGRRVPSPKALSRINRAIAKLAGHPQVGPYLDSEAMLGGLLDPSQHIPVEVDSRRAFDDRAIVLSADYSMNLDSLIRATLALLDRYGSYFSDGYREHVEGYMRASGATNARRFAVELNQAFQRILIAELWPPSAPIGFNAVFEVLQRHGIDVNVTEFGSFIIAWEQVQWAVRRELAVANPSASSKERLAAEKRIFDALDKRFELHLKTHDARRSQQGDHP